MDISDSVKYVGVDDNSIDLFEGQFEVPLGMSYNSYVVIDEKTAVMDSVDANFGEEWLSKVESALGGRKADYLVVQHMEMDHSSNVLAFAEKYPDAKIVASKVAFTMMKNMFGTDFPGRQIVAAEGSELKLGKKTLAFIAAPNVHWPEVVMTAIKEDGILFSADAFGKFGAYGAEEPEGWSCEARRYYFGIVGKFGANVQSVMEKIKPLGIGTICPLHGPVLTGNDAAEAVRLYGIWSSYEAESDGVAVFYTSVYGHTKKAAESLAEKLRARGCPKVALNDLAREDAFECVEDAFRYGKLVLASTTYNGGVFPAMREFIERLCERGFRNRTVALVENGSWAPAAARTMASLLEGCKDITIIGEKATIKISPTAETDSMLDAIADAMTK